MRATLTGKDFKALITAVRRFPSVGSFAGAGVVNLTAVAGKLTATHLGVATARARVPVEGDLPLTGVDERVVDGFAPLCADTSKVVLSREDNTLMIKCKDREVRPIVAEASAEHKIPSVKGMDGIEISEEIAPRIAYLSDVAHSDTSRAELCCVMLTADGEIIASSQTIIAVLKGSKLSANVAVPLVLAKSLLKGDVLYPGPRETVVKTEIATYSMAAPVKAQAEFPIGKIKEFGKSKTSECAVVDGTKLAAALADCNSCLSKLAPLDIILDLTFGEKLELSAANGPTVFRAPVPLLASKKEVKFRAPLTEIIKISAFLNEDKVVVARGEHGDMFMRLAVGWIWFPAWIEPKK